MLERLTVRSLGIISAVELELDTDSAEDAGGYAKELGEDFYTKQREMMLEVVADSDVVITTAAIPGKRAPTLVTAEVVARMAPGSVIVAVVEAVSVLPASSVTVRVTV